jgi:hypothetical protein
VRLDPVPSFSLFTTKPKRMSKTFSALEVRLVFLSRVDNLRLKSAQNVRFGQPVTIGRKIARGPPQNLPGGGPRVKILSIHAGKTEEFNR